MQLSVKTITKKKKKKDCEKKNCTRFNRRHEKQICGSNWTPYALNYKQSYIFRKLISSKKVFKKWNKKKKKEKKNWKNPMGVFDFVLNKK